jgi:hypothetical protein
VALSVVCLVSALIVAIKLVKPAHPLLALLGVFVPLVLFVVGGLKAAEWRLTRTLVGGTLTVALICILALVAGVAFLITSAGLYLGGELRPAGLSDRVYAELQVVHFSGYERFRGR